MCAGVLFLICWNIKGDIYSLFVTFRRWANGELFFQQQKGEYMFCNGPEMDGGDTACLGLTTIIEITIPRCQSSSAMTLDDAGGLAGPIKNVTLD